MSSGGYDGPSASPGTTGCGRLTFTTVLASVDPATLGSLQADDAGKVVLQDTNPRRIEVLVNGVVVGSIVDRWQELLECLSAGYDYDAIVKQVGPPLRVLVRPASA